MWGLLVLVALCSASPISLPMRRHEVVASGRSRRFALGGGTQEAMYTVALQLGSRSVNMLVDSGSMLFGLVAAGCKAVESGAACPAPGALYDPGANGATGPLSCGDMPGCHQCVDGHCMASVQYVDHAGASGPVYRASLVYNAVGNVSTVFFAAMSRTEGHFSTPLYDGILGLSYADSQNGVPDLLSSLNQFAHVPTVYGLCLDEAGGQLSLGAADPRYMANASAPIQWVPVVPPYRAWYVSGRALTVGSSGAPIPIGASRTVVDSGTTLMVLPQAVLMQVVAQLRALCPTASAEVRELLCGQNNLFAVAAGQCVQFSVSTLAQLPPIVVHLNADLASDSRASPVSIPIAARQYVHHAADGSSACGVFALVPLKDASDLILLGDVFMRMSVFMAERRGMVCVLVFADFFFQYVIFDREQNRIGFAEPRCDTRASSEPAGIVALAVVLSVAVVGAVAAFAIIWFLQRSSGGGGSGHVLGGRPGVRRLEEEMQ